MKKSNRIVGRVSKSKLTIHDFSCIKDLAIDFNRLTVLIGEQASGKSIVCKFYFYFTQGLRKVLANSFHNDDDFEDFKNRYAEEFEKIFPKTAWINDSFQIEWETERDKISIKHGKGSKKIRFEFSGFEETFDSLFNRGNDCRKGNRQAIETDLKQLSCILRWEEIQRQAAIPFVDYVPASRSFFSTVQNTVFTLLANDIGIDYFLKEFGQKLETVRFKYFRRFDRITMAEPLRRDVLHGQYEYDGKEQWIVQDDNHKVRLADASSGQQESLPLILFLSNLLPNQNEDSGRERVPVQNEKPKVVVIEEPEAHLYPTAQQAIVNYIGELLHASSGTLGSIITTHSPYILTCLNNVIAKTQLPQTDVSAYHLNAGCAESIFNQDVGLIDAVRFDDVSTQIANESV